MKVKRLGTFGVDSGQFMIVDPCYLDTWKDNEFNLREDAVGEFSFNSQDRSDVW